MPISDGLLYATDFQLDELTITSASGQRVDIREVLRELVLYEDLFANAMTGSVFISDTQNLINVLPIVGGEYLSVTVIKPSTTAKIQKVFRIYKITNRAKASPSSEDYILHFCSEELILNESILVANSYRDSTVSAIVRDVAMKYLQISPKKFPASELTETVGNFNVVVPYWTPFYTINWLARMARKSTTPGCSFLFFEDSLGYHFTAIELLVQQDPIQVINFMPLSLAGQTREKNDKSDTQQRLESAEDYQLSNSPDLFRGLSSGTYSSKLMRVNIMDRQVKISTQNGLEFFKKTKHANPNSYLQPQMDRMDVTLTERHDAYFRVAVDNLKVETWMLQRNAYLSGLHAFQLKVSVPGSMLLRIGQVITLNLPAASIGRTEEKVLDKLYSGKYLITAIQHKIDRNKYVCILELSKDSVATAVPSVVEGSPGTDKLRQA